MRLGHVALDGSKVQANASKHKAMTYERMAEEEKRLSLEIEELLERAGTIDQEEDERFARRKSIVEPALGQIKGARGFRRFSLRSFFKVRAEWTLVCLTHNLLKLYRSKLATVASV